MGDDAEILRVVSSANVACGGHAGDPETMFRTLSLASDNGVVVGAHPGYNDRTGFGRRIIPMKTTEITHMVAAQIGALMGVAALTSASIEYVKPHGALANLAACDTEVAKAIVDAVSQIDPSLPILAISGTEVEKLCHKIGRPVFSEVFADRAYLSSGQLVPRDHPDAMITDPATAAKRLVNFFDSGNMPVIDGDPISLEAHSICVHGDSPQSLEMARLLKLELQNAGLQIRTFIQSEND